MTTETKPAYLVPIEDVLIVRELMRRKMLTPDTEEGWRAALALAAVPASAQQQAEPVVWKEKLIELADRLDQELTTGVQWSNAQFACFDVSGELRDLVQRNGGAPNEKDWKTRALEAEEANRRFIEQLNSENGPTHMGEPVVSKQQAEPGADEPAYYVRRVHEGHPPEFNTVDEFSDGQGGGVPLFRKAKVVHTCDGDSFVLEFERWNAETGALPRGGSWMAEVSDIIQRAAQSGQRAGVAEDARDAARWRAVEPYLGIADVGDEDFIYGLTVEADRLETDSNNLILWKSLADASVGAAIDALIAAPTQQEGDHA
jgi:hypothetical protein